MRAATGLLLILCLCLGVACGGSESSSAKATATLGPGGGPGAGNGASATQQPAATQPASSSGAVPDACKVFTEPQVKAAMTEDVAKKTAASSTAALSVCQWDGASSGRRFVYVTIRQAQFGASVFTSSFKSRPDGQAVSGIGKEAIAIVGQNTPNDYRFITGAILTDALFIQIDIGGPNRSDAEALSTLTTAMRTLISGIK